METTQLDVSENAGRRVFREEVIAGLSDHPKQLPCKYFYDKRGSELFDRICELDEYYLTRTEQAIMDRYAVEMARQLGPGVRLVEYGSGSSTKTRVLLNQLINPSAYVPVDISHRHLHDVARGLRKDFPGIEVLPVTADFTAPFELPSPTEPESHTAVYFPGSTIGNFQEDAAEELLGVIARQVGIGGGLLIGIDLVKDVSVLEDAYDDASGVTADFNLNLLHRMRNELGAELNPDAFEHHAFFSEQNSRIEIYLRSRSRQVVVIDDCRVNFEAGELVHTEYSHKYTIEGFAELAGRAGFGLHQSWTDERGYFAVLHLVVESA